ncbi:hypothetical protein HMPREF0201_00860 [Cedecea davisae DSM 4568]|uniref:Uncharacterized protein n=1 Tax=Cedecea davisae DSM 4568 TaxID=566551 RepID=S3JG30_9ENTR|nr:hypothetical protein HMPREF0201_00860 [Cedecea davisae DSM 4568]
MYVDSEATLQERRNSNKRQYSKMEKAAKAAFGNYTALQKFASITAVGR